MTRHEFLENTKHLSTRQSEYCELSAVSSLLLSKGVISTQEFEQEFVKAMCGQDWEKEDQEPYDTPVAR